jgi:hypothetical protein
MGWNRQQFRAERRQMQPARLRHARIPLEKAHCADCGRELAVTHLVACYGERCKRCFDALWQGVAMATASYERL